MAYNDFIVVEGMDGAGKTTLVNALASYFPDALITREPTKECHGLEEFLEDRRRHWKEEIRPVLERGGMVICDRFSDSTAVYQGGIAESPITPEQWGELKEGQIEHGQEAGLTLVLVCDPLLALERIRARAGEKGVDGEWETEEKLNRQYAFYRLLALVQPRHQLIDTTRFSPEAVTKLAIGKIANRNS